MGPALLMEDRKARRDIFLSERLGAVGLSDNTTSARLGTAAHIFAVFARRSRGDDHRIFKFNAAVFYGKVWFHNIFSPSNIKDENKEAFMRHINASY